MSTDTAYATDVESTEKPEPEVTERWVSFQLGEQTFGLDVLGVQEVLRMNSPAPVPGAPRLCLGVINLRGHIVPVLDLRRLLSMADEPDSEDTRLLIVDHLSDAVALRVDRVGEVLNLAQSSIDEAPRVGDRLTPEQVRGVVRRGSRVLILLHAEALLRAAASTF